MHRIAICTPQRNPYSTTFIQAHLEGLDAKVTHLYGKFFPDRFGSSGRTIYQARNATKYWLKARHVGQPKAYRDHLLAQVLRRHKVDLVLAEFGPVGAEVVDACRLAGVPLIVHFHGFDAHAQAALDQYQERYQAMFRYATYVVGVSQHMMAQLRQLGAPEGKLVYNCYGPDDRYFEVTPAFDTPHFVAVGRFVAKKAPHLTLAAFRAVWQQHPEAHLTMVGDGDLLPVCEQLVRGWRMEKAVTFAGVLSPADILQRYDQFCAFVQHSITAPNGDAEGTPNGVLEAGAAGVPVISTRHAGIPDVVIDGETGWLVAEGDTIGMADAMLRVARDLPAARRMGQAGRQRIRQHFTMRQHLDKLNTLISNALK